MFNQPRKLARRRFVCDIEERTHQEMMLITKIWRNREDFEKKDVNTTGIHPGKVRVTDYFVYTRMLSYRRSSDLRACK